MDIRSCLQVQNIQLHLVKDQTEAWGLLRGGGRGVSQRRPSHFTQEITEGEEATLLMCLKVTQGPKGMTLF